MPNKDLVSHPGMYFENFMWEGDFHYSLQSYKSGKVPIFQLSIGKNLLQHVSHSKLDIHMHFNKLI